MKKVLKITWVILCIVVSVVYLLSCFSAFIPVAYFSCSSIFGILFPYILPLFLLICLICFFIQKKSAVILLCLLPCSYRNFTSTFASNKNSWKDAKDSGTLRIMTWNVEDFLNLLHKHETASGGSAQMLALIEKTQPDILCLQEYFDVEKSSWAVSMGEALDSAGYHYRYFSNDHLVRFDNHSLLVRGVAIFSKTPFTDSGRINIYHYEKENENMVFADILFNKKPIRIFTAHLLSYAFYDDTASDVKKGKNIYEITFKRKHSVFNRLTGTELVHEKEAALIRDQIAASPYPVIYCGDMNTTPTSYSYRFLKGPLQDAFLNKGAGIGATFYKILPTLRIDYCLADSKMKVLQCKVDEQKISDHYPVITDVQWK